MYFENEDQVRHILGSHGYLGLLGSMITIRQRQLQTFTLEGARMVKGLFGNTRIDIMPSGNISPQLPKSVCNIGLGEQI